MTSSSIAPKHESVVHMLVDAATQSPEREALVCGEQRVNYADYLSAVSGFAEHLLALELMGSRVAIIMRNSIDICIAMFGAQMAGAQIVPLNPRYTEAELLTLLEDADVSALIHDEENIEREQTMATKLGIPHRIAVGPSNRLVDFYREEPPRLPAAAELAELLFTGGTTGRSKGANYDHNTLITNLAQREALVFGNPDVERLLCVMPLYHCYAINMCLHNMVSYRGALVIVEPFSPEAVLNTIETEQISVFGGSPTLFAALMASPAFEHTNFSSLKVTYSGASALSDAMLDHWQSATDSIVIEGYGQTEAGPVISFNPIDGTRKRGSVGVAVPDTRIQIVDVEQGQQVLPANTCGEIRIQGPQIMNGYRNRPEESAAAVRDGWLYTGDLGELDDDGYLYIRGRKKEMIIVSGFNVYPLEIEGVLSAHPAVLECAVVGCKDERRGEIPIAFVVLRAGAETAPAELSAYCENVLTRYKIPQTFNIVPALAKTSVGKIDKLTLVAQANATL